MPSDAFGFSKSLFGNRFRRSNGMSHFFKNKTFSLVSPNAAFASSSGGNGNQIDNAFFQAAPASRLSFGTNSMEMTLAATLKPISPQKDKTLTRSAFVDEEQAFTEAPKEEVPTDTTQKPVPVQKGRTMTRSAGLWSRSAISDESEQAPVLGSLGDTVGSVTSMNTSGLTGATPVAAETTVQNLTQTVSQSESVMKNNDSGSNSPETSATSGSGASSQAGNVSTVVTEAAQAVTEVVSLLHITTEVIEIGRAHV